MVYGLHDCSLHLWKMRDWAGESLVLEGRTHVVSCVSGSIKETQIVSGFLKETRRI